MKWVVFERGRLVTGPPLAEQMTSRLYNVGRPNPFVGAQRISQIQVTYRKNDFLETWTFSPFLVMEADHMGAKPTMDTATLGWRDALN